METEQKTKVCRTCKIEKNVEEFSKDKKSLRGIKYICRICNNIYNNVKTRWSHEQKCKLNKNNKDI